MELSLEYQMVYIGRGLHALYCWRNDCLGPVGTIIYTKMSNNLQCSEARTRVDIINIHVLIKFRHDYLPEEWKREDGIACSMLNHLQEQVDVIHIPVVFESSPESVLEACDFKHDVPQVNWVWVKPEKARIEYGIDTDANLAILLGWKEVCVRETPLPGWEEDEHSSEGEVSSTLLSGIPPFGTSMRVVPSWSTDEAVALSLLVNLSKKSDFDYHWWKFGKKYSCALRNNGADVSFSEEWISSWYSTLQLAICHAIILYLSNLPAGTYLSPYSSD